jgi:hypothetical protein
VTLDDLVEANPPEETNAISTFMTLPFVMPRLQAENTFAEGPPPPKHRSRLHFQPIEPSEGSFISRYERRAAGVVGGARRAQLSPRDWGIASPSSRRLKSLSIIHF